MRRLLRSQELDAFEFHEDMGNYTWVIPGWFLDATADGRITHNDTQTCLRVGEKLLPIPDGSWVFLINGEISFTDERTMSLLTYPAQR